MQEDSNEFIAYYGGTVKPGDDFASQWFYDFEPLLKVGTALPGVESFSGTGDYRLSSNESEAPANQYLESSSTLTSRGERLAQIDGDYIGQGRHMFQLVTGSEYRDVEDGFLYLESPQSTQPDLRIARFTSRTDYYVLRGKDQTDPHFTDVIGRRDKWKDGETFVYNGGNWYAKTLDFTSPIHVNNNEFVKNPQDGDILYWDQKRVSWVAQPFKGLVGRDLNDLGDVDLDTPYKSNDILYYDAQSGKFITVNFSDLGKVAGLLDVSFYRGLQTGDVFTWDAERRVWDLAPFSRTIELNELNDVSEFAENGTLVYYSVTDQWIGRTTSISEDDIIGEWISYRYPDWKIGRYLNRPVTVWSTGEFVTQYNTTKLPEAGFDETEVYFKEGPQLTSNRGRGDAGDFEYGETHAGLPFGIWGGGDFETGEDDLPVEMITGPDGAEMLETVTVEAPPGANSTRYDGVSPLPPTFDPIKEVPADFRVAFCMNWNQYDTTNSLSRAPFHTDTTGRDWVLADDDPTPPSRRPQAPTTSATTSGLLFPLQPAYTSASFENRLKTGTSRAGGYGNVTKMDDELSVIDEDFTAEFIHILDLYRYYFSNNPPLGGYIPLEDERRAVWMLGTAAEVDFSNPGVGRGWDIRAYNVINRSELSDEGIFYQQGFKFSWWGADGTPYVIDFLMGPEFIGVDNRDRGFDHTIIMRSVRRQSITLIHNGMRVEKFHPKLNEPWRDVRQFDRPRMGLGMDCQVNSDIGDDYPGVMSSARLVKGKCLYGFSARFPDKDLSSSAN